MNAYKVGMALATSRIDIKNGPTVGAAAPPAEKGWLGVVIVLGLVAAIYVPPMLKGK